MKSSLLISLLLGMTFGSSFSQVPQLVPGWPYNINPTPALTPRFDFSSGFYDYSIFFNTDDGMIDRFNLNASFFPGWPLIIDSVVFGITPIVVDLNRDGYMDNVLFGISNTFGFSQSFIFAVDHFGSVMPGFPIPINHPVSLNVADFDHDGEYEIMSFSAREGLIHCFNHLGVEKPGWPIPLPSDVIGNTVAGSGGAVADFDLDETNEYVIQGLYHIYAYRFDGTMQPGFPIGLPQIDSTYTFSNNWNWPPTLGDIDHNGFPEIIAAADDVTFEAPWFNAYLYVFEHTGEIKENWPLFFPHAVIKEAPVPSDINNDGMIELGFQARDSFYFIEPNASRLAPWPVVIPPPGIFSVMTNADLIIVDINGDGYCEIFHDYNVLFADSIGSDSIAWFGHSYFFAMDRNGQELNGYPFIINGSYLGRPPNFAFDPLSHKLYMAVYTDNLAPPGTHGIDSGYVNVYRFPDSTGVPNQWPMLSHDNLLTRNYNFVDRVTAIADDTPPPLPKSAILKQNYPNPFNSTTIIEYTLPKEEQVTLSLYDILGRKLRISMRGFTRLETGRFRSIWDNTPVEFIIWC